MKNDIKAHALRCLMEHLSETYLQAGWHDDLEYWLWDHILGQKNTVHKLDVAALKWLSDEANGWWLSNAENEQVFVDLPKWHRIYRE